MTGFKPAEPLPVTTYFTDAELAALRRLADLGYGEKQLCTVVQYLVARELDDLRRSGVLTLER